MIDEMKDHTNAVAVSCRGVVKDFGTGNTRIRALRGIDWDVYSGEMTLLVGPSGCGKTTLISIVAGVLDPTQGDVEIFGRRQSTLTRKARVQFRAESIGFIFQQYNLLPALTATQNIAVPLLIAGWRHQQAIERARAIVDAVGLSDRANARPAEMSGGQQQRVAIGRALIHEPRLLVCDEPTAALDAHTGQLVMDLIKRIAVQPGRAVVVVTHDSRVFKYGDRIAHMSDGRIEQIEHVDAATESAAAGQENS